VTARIPTQRAPVGDAWAEAMARGLAAHDAAESSPTSRVQIAIAAALVIYGDHVLTRYRHRLALVPATRGAKWAHARCSCGWEGPRRGTTWQAHRLHGDWTQHLRDNDREDSDV
jgi:hypothetical protein